MALNKQPISINFSGGLDQKTDPFQVQAGKFSALSNSVFNKVGRMQKRNGFGNLTTVSNASTVTNYNDTLVSIGTELNAYSPDNNQVVNAGFIQPLSLSTQALVRSATSQTTVDVAVDSSGLCCSTWLDSNGSSYYQVSDSITGQTVVPAVALPSTATMPRVFVLGRYFIVTYLATVTAAPHFQYIAIPLLMPNSPHAAVDIATSVASITVAYDGCVANNNLYLSWSSTVGGGAISNTYLDSTLITHGTTVIASLSADKISVTVDTSGSTATVWVSFYKASTNTIKAAAFSASLVNILAATTVVSSITINELTSTAMSNSLKVFYEVANTYSYTPNAKSDYISKNSLTLAGVVGTPSVVLRGVGLGSKAYYDFSHSKSVMIATYGQTYQPTYFLIDSSGNVLAKFAYSNGGGYAINQILPSIYEHDEVLQVGYLFKDLLASVNKTQGIANVNGIYSQTGINLISLTLDSLIDSSTIAGDLHMSGGFLWMYDGVKPVEHSFHVWPEDLAVTTSATGGNLADQIYFYVATYEWTDAQGNIHRSAPSVPYQIDSTGGGGTNTNTVFVPYLRQTYKTANKVRIVIYRWSTAQQNYYRITSITSPQLNNPAADSLTYVDTQADSVILGNDLLYTTGGVVENIAAPSSNALALFKSRLFLVDAEDPNLLWYSKQVIQNTPVEMSDLFTIYVAPSTGAQGSTGPTSCISAMDDKLIAFKKDAIYYITGTGPDNTGSNNDFSDATFITSTVGCDNPRSIVLTPDGLMFQSDKGIWLLGRNLSTSYIGADVEESNGQVVTSAVCIPGTNQVRFTLDNGTFLMYDYYVRQWGTFNNLSAISSTIFNSMQTYLDSTGRIFQETPGLYLDGSTPVLMSFTSSWINMAGIQGYERAYFLDILGTYISPHKLSVQISYDYNSSPSQTSLITPDNYNAPWGGDSVWGASTPWGGSGVLEQWKIHFQRQTCMSFQISITESFDPFFGTAAGAGLTLSSLTCLIGLKKGVRPIRAANSVG